jgi:hypothetical protein
MTRPRLATASMSAPLSDELVAALAALADSWARSHPPEPRKKGAKSEQKLTPAKKESRAGVALSAERRASRGAKAQ